MTSITHATAERVDARTKVRTLTSAGVFVGMFALGLGFSLRLLNPWDESWFVQVVARMRSGDVLYRDISYGAGPLPAYATDAVTYLAGVDVIAVKLVVVFAFAASALLAWLIAEQLGIGFSGRLLLLGALAYFAPPLQQPPYSPLATMFVLAAFLAALRARGSTNERTADLAAVAGGVAAAFAFASKQDVGVYALAALLIVLLVQRRLRNCLLALSSFGVVVGAVTALLWLSGGLARYVDYGFTGKGAYVHARVPFATGVDGVLQTVRDVHSVASAEAAYWALGFFLPCLAVGGALALLLARQRNAPHAVPVVVFGAAGAATLFPRFDVLHVAYIAPVLVVLLAYSLHAWRARLHPSVFLATALWASVAVLLMATLPFRLAHSSATDLSTLPHLRGTFIQERDLEGWQREAAALRSAAGRTPNVLLLLPDAGFRYLTTGLHNPTPFDFPFVTTFGRDGQERVIDSLESGRIAQVCLGRSWFGLEPRQLVNYVRTTMRMRSQLGFCSLYVRRA